MVFRSEPEKKKGVRSTTHATITFSNKEMKAIAAVFNFSNEQMDFLKNLFISNKITKPSLFIQDSDALENLFDKTFSDLESNEPSTRSIEKQKTILFTIRESIYTRRKAGEIITSTRELKSGQGFTMTIQSGEQYQSAIIENVTEGLLCMIPRDLFGKIGRAHV